MSDRRELDSFDMNSATLVCEWTVTAKTPDDGVERVWGSRSKRRDDKDHRNRYWNRPDAELLHSKTVG